MAEEIAEWSRGGGGDDSDDDGGGDGGGDGRGDGDGGESRDGGARGGSRVCYVRKEVLAQSLSHLCALGPLVRELRLLERKGRRKGKVSEKKGDSEEECISSHNTYILSRIRAVFSTGDHPGLGNTF